MRTVDVTWDQVAERFEANGTVRGHTVQITAPAQPDVKRRPTGFSATELLLAGIGSCSAWDIVEILRKTRTPVAGLAVRVTGEQDEDPPWAYHAIHLHFTFTGPDIEPAVVERAIRLSVDKYCSVIATVRATAHITDSYEILGEAAAPVA
jgi:putative redox protein